MIISNGAGNGQSCVASGNCFYPANALIATGDILGWVNQDSVSHTVTSGKPSDSNSGASFDSGLIKPGNTYSLRFPYAGIYYYFCTVHPWMTGSITTKSAGSNTQTQYSCPTGYFLANDNLCHFYVAPTLSLQSPTVSGLTSTFSGVTQAVSYDAQISKIVWDWGDGYSTVGWFPQSHTYSQSGTYTVKVTSYDTYGWSRWQAYSVSVQSQQSTQHSFFQGLHYKSKPVTTIQSNTVNWYFGDSMGNKYHWSMPLTTYDAFIQQPISVGALKLTLPSGQTVSTYDYRQFVKTIMTHPNFANVIDQVYNNAGNDEQFIYETWYVVSEMTTYNVDMTNSNLWPLEVFTRGEGDCKDKSILIADMLHSSSHTKNWQITLEILDSNNPSNPTTVNHMIVLVNTGQKNYAIESTSTPDNNGLNVWAGKSIVGWNIPT